MNHLKLKYEHKLATAAQWTFQFCACVVNIYLANAVQWIRAVCAKWRFMLCLHFHYLFYVVSAVHHVELFNVIQWKTTLDLVV